MSGFSLTIDVEASGWPQALRLQSNTIDFGDLERLTDVRGTVDILGLIGVGRAPAEEEAAIRSEALALSRVEAAVRRR